MQKKETMIHSMTGFGKKTLQLPNKKITVEIKSLNSKQLEVFVRTPIIYKEKEMEIRSFLSKKLKRGKVDLTILVEDLNTENTTQINQEIVLDYFNQLKKIGTLALKDCLDGILKLPNVMKQKVEELDHEEWGLVFQTIEEAVEELISFRKQEGAMLEQLFEEKIQKIDSLLNEVPQYEQERVDRIQTTIADKLKDLAINYDANRLEQEMIYYIEKLDINEEKTRLKNHLSYFKETINQSVGQGKKLGFICQEMGREINTLGSKSNHAEMQKIVIKMKDQLEQIKEQVFNAL